MGKKYMTEKLHVATRKLLMPTRTGIFCRSNEGASTGSGAMNSSTTRKSTAKTLATTTEAMTLGSDHCGHSRQYVTVTMYIEPYR